MVSILGDKSEMVHSAFSLREEHDSATKVRGDCVKQVDKARCKINKKDMVKCSRVLRIHIRDCEDWL